MVFQVIHWLKASPILGKVLAVLLVSSSSEDQDSLS